MAQNLSNLVNNLPSELLIDRDTFNNIINKDILTKIPQNKLNLILNKYLPSSLSDQDKLNTINDLFDNKLNFLNINQMDTFYKQAKIHKFEPDLVKTLNEFKLLKKKAYRLEEKKFQLNLLNEVLDRKKLLMEKALNSPPNIFINYNKMIMNDNDDFNRKVDERYYKELEKIDLEDNLDEDKINKNQNSDDEEELCNINKINYSVNKQEYLMMLKNHKRKKIRNQINENDLEELSIKKVLDRILENPSKSFKLEIEQKIQSKNSKLKQNKKSVIKKSSSNELKSSSVKINELNKQKLDESIVTAKSSNNNLGLLTNNESSNYNLKNNENKINNYEKEPPSFFSLIRDIFYNNSTNEFKLTLHKLEEFVKEKLKLYDPKLSLSGWKVDLVQSAMNYLSSALPPPKNIPLVDYKEKNQQWQWIGNDGSDSDEILIKLNNDWMIELNKYSLLDPNRSVPPAIYQTTWTVKESTKEEKEEYRKQELLRYKNPNKSFTFSLHNYKSVVGPVKGSSSNYSLAKQKDKPKPETSLLKERPAFVTLLSLVKDSAARLPNGEGTRTDIATLLKDSQYLRDDLQDADISNIVSGALDRLHYEKDCSVRYDEKRKIWIYLHRFRSEDDFNRLHQMQIDANLAKKSIQQKVTKKSSNLNKLNNSNTSKMPNINITTSIDNVINSITTSSINNNQVTIISRTINDNKIDDQNIIKSNQEPIKSDVNIIDCTLLKQIPYQNDEISCKRELNGKKKLNNSTSKKVPTSKQVIIKSINTSELVNKSIKQKYQKQTASNKRLKTENSELEIKNVINNRTISTDQLIKQTEQLNHQIPSNKLNHTSFTLPVLTNNNNQKTTITKEDVNKILIQQNNTNRINLSNGSLILSPSNNTINGFTSFTMSKSGNQILIHPQNGTIGNCLTLKGKLITNPSNNSPLSLRTVQGMRIVPISQNANLSQQQLIQQHQQITSNNINSNNLTKPQIISKTILPKCTDNLPTQINISTSSSNHPKSIIMSCPLTLSTKTSS